MKNALKDLIDILFWLLIGWLGLVIALVLIGLAFGVVFWLIGLF